MNRNLAHKGRRAYLAAPALAGTVASMILTIAVVTLWLGTVMNPWLAALIGAGFDGRGSRRCPTSAGSRARATTTGG